MGTRRILVTGFEPFGPHESNPSQEVTLGLEGLHVVADPNGGVGIEIEITPRILTVDRFGAIETAEALYSGEKWDAILHMGLCESCVLPRLEQRAQNCVNMRIPDNGGRMLKDTLVDEKGDIGCWIDLEMWDKNHFSSDYDISFDAGTFVCNETYYHTLHALQSQLHKPIPPPCLFLHIPLAKRFDVKAASQFALECIGAMLGSPQSPVVEVVAALIRDDTGNVLLAQREDDLTWEFPGGKCEKDENWAVAMERELSEELELCVEAIRIIGTWEHFRDNKLLRIHLIACTEPLEQPSIDPEVHRKIMWYDPLKLDDLNWTGRDGEMMEYIAKYNSVPC